MKIAIIGGGAAGVFSALIAKEANPQAEVIIFEKSAHLLSKVRISGGGRCNVTHGCFEPSLLVRNYPRGYRELLGSFHRFQPQNMIAWLQARGVILKQEEDGRIFPISNSSETIIHCFVQEAKKLGISFRMRSKIERIERGFTLYFRDETPLTVTRVILATGSAKEGWECARALGHTIQDPVPSLFTFNISSFPLAELAGVTHPHVAIKLEGSPFEQKGTLLITHWGFSGPAVLKLSAFAARYLAEKDYEANVILDWCPGYTENQLKEWLENEKIQQPTRHIGSVRLDPLPKSLWQCLCARALLDPHQPLRSFSKAAFVKLCAILKRDSYVLSGKTTHKEEFVTCGGVTLSEVSFKTMESKLCTGLFFAGEILDIDGVTGGFNFQNCWTTGWLAGQAAVNSP